MRSAIALRRPAPARPSDVLAVALAAAYAGLEAIALGGVLTGPALLALPLPFVVAVVVLLRRAPLTGPKAAALGAALVAGSAVVVSVAVAVAGTALLVVPVMAVAAVVCARFPAASLIALFAMTGFFGSLEVFAGFSAPLLADVIVAALWVAAVWTWLVRGAADRRTWLWPALAGVAVYVAVSAFEILLADQTIAALQSFRASTWYLSAALLIALAPWPAAARERALRGVVLTAGLVGAYATFRWIVGPAEQERALAAAIANNFLDGELRPVGSFYTAKELAAWSAITLPFLVGVGLAWRGAWRLVAVLAAAACLLGMLAADVRAGTAAAVPAVAAVLAMHQAAQAFRGHRGAVVLVAAALAVAGGATAYAVTVGSDPGAGQRYSAILDPAEDPSYQGRLIKWRAALDEIEEVPFGHGLGTSGRAQKRYGRVVNVGSVDVDNSYLKIAYEQGFFVMAGYVLALGLLLAGLLHRGVTTLDRRRSGPALAAAGSLVAMLVLFWAGTYVEGLPALAGWILIGLGVSRFTAGEPAGGEPADARAEEPAAVSGAPPGR